MEKKHQQKKKHQWDETSTITVMIISCICVLVILAASLTVTGKASAVPTEQGIYNLLSQAKYVSGEGKTKCNVLCAREGLSCVLGKVNGELKSCSSKLDGEYACVCASPEEIIQEVPSIFNSPAPPPRQIDACLTYCSDWYNNCINNEENTLETCELNILTCNINCDYQKCTEESCFVEQIGLLCQGYTTLCEENNFPICEEEVPINCCQEFCNNEDKVTHKIACENNCESGYDGSIVTIPEIETLCDGIDDDEDGTIDEGCQWCCRDEDNDGFPIDYNNIPRQFSFSCSGNFGTPCKDVDSCLVQSPESIDKVARCPLDLNDNDPNIRGMDCNDFCTQEYNQCVNSESHEVCILEFNTCQSTCEVPALEICNGIDDDGDGIIDDGTC